MKKITLVWFVFFVMIANFTFAYDLPESHKLAAEGLLIAMDFDNTLKQVINFQLDMEIKKNEELILYRDVIRNFLSKYLSYEALKDDLIRIYTSEFTEEELNRAVIFYGSPTGKKFIKKQAILFQRAAMLGQRRIEIKIVAGQIKKLDSTPNRSFENRREHAGAFPVSLLHVRQRKPFWDTTYADLDASTFGGPSQEALDITASLHAGATVLDLGCGGGRNALFLSKCGFDATAQQ